MKHQFVKRFSAACIAMLAFVFLIFAATGVYAAKKPIVLKKYPNIKIGFTSQNFSKWLPPNVQNLKTLINYANQNGFAFIELRDPGAMLALNDCKAIAAYAKQKKVEIVYAMGVGGLDANYFEVFSRGLANALVFNGPRYVRTASCGNEFGVNPKKQFWTAAEFSQLVTNINQAANTAKTFGMTLLVENAFEGLNGDAVTTFGTAELFSASGVNANVGFQLDMANFFCVSRVENPTDKVSAFFEANAMRTGYSHIKTSVNHQPNQFLNGNELAFDTYFNALRKQGSAYVALELAPAATLDEVYQNHTKSVEYLINNY